MGETEKSDTFHTSNIPKYHCYFQHKKTPKYVLHHGVGRSNYQSVHQYGLVPTLSDGGNLKKWYFPFSNIPNYHCYFKHKKTPKYVFHHGVGRSKYQSVHQCGLVPTLSDGGN